MNIRTQIGEILVKNNLRTDQVAIGELVQMFEAQQWRHDMIVAGLEAEIEQRAVLLAYEKLKETGQLNLDEGGVRAVIEHLTK
jgi:hypothetical protein